MRIINSAEELVDVCKQYDNSVVYGTGNVAKTIVRYLIKPEVDLAPVNIVTNTKDRVKTLKAIKNIKVISLIKWAKSKNKGLAIVALQEFLVDKAVADLKEVGADNIVVISEQLFLTLSWAENVPMGFMCAGFTKCATSALNKALKANKSYFLSRQKETNYMHWRNNYDDSPERFKTMYYPKWKKNQVLGNFEPTYHRHARPIYECFGPDMKLIFMMRNPVNATYSYFKMMMRRTQKRTQIKYYLKHNKFNVDMFDDYNRDYIFNNRDDRFKYDKYINQFLQYWDKENVMFIFFEDIIKDTERVMKEVQEFTGVEPVVISELPKENIGTTVSKNFICAVIQAVSFKLRLRIMSIPSKKIKKWYRNFDKWLIKYTQVENNEKMSAESRAELTEFYMDSIKNVEKITGRNLEGVWY